MLWDITGSTNRAKKGTLISLSFAKLPKAAMILGIAAASVSCTDSSGLLLIRVRQGKRFTKYGLSMAQEKKIIWDQNNCTLLSIFNSYSSSVVLLNHTKMNLLATQNVEKKKKNVLNAKEYT